MNNKKAMDWLEDLNLGVCNKKILLDTKYVIACFKGHQALGKIEELKKWLDNFINFEEGANENILSGEKWIESRKQVIHFAKEVKAML